MVDPTALDRDHSPELVAVLEQAADALLKYAQAPIAALVLRGIERACWRLQDADRCEAILRKRAEDWLASVAAFRQAAGDTGALAETLGWLWARCDERDYSADVAEAMLTLQEDARGLLECTTQLASDVGRVAGEASATWCERDDALSKRFAGVHALCSAMGFCLQEEPRRRRGSRRSN